MGEGIIMEIRNPRYNAKGGIDCEINYVILGWVPYSYFDGDVIGDAQAIHDKLMEMEIAPYIPPTEPEPKTFAQLRKECIDNVDLIAKEKRDFIVQNYSSAEMASWPIKREEALAWLSNPNYQLIEQLAPNLKVEAEYRQINIDLLVDKVMEKARQLSLLEAAIAGYTGYLQDLIRSVPDDDFETLAIIDIHTGWPV